MEYLMGILSIAANGSLVNTIRRCDSPGGIRGTKHLSRVLLWVLTGELNTQITNKKVGFPLRLTKKF